MPETIVTSAVTRTCLTGLPISVIGYRLIMRLTKSAWTLILMVIGTAGLLTALRIRGFHMWDLPFFIFGGAIFAYAIFGWH